MGKKSIWSGLAVLILSLPRISAGQDASSPGGSLLRILSPTMGPTSHLSAEAEVVPSTAQ